MHHAGCHLAKEKDSNVLPLTDLELDDLGPGSVFRLRFLGSVSVDGEDHYLDHPKPKKAMVEEAVLKIKVLKPTFTKSSIY